MSQFADRPQYSTRQPPNFQPLAENSRVLKGVGKHSSNTTQGLKIPNLQCYHLRALYATLGVKLQALDQTTALWISPNSQPKACDPLFATWRSTSRFTQDVAWQRLHLAIQGNQRILARYLLRFFSGQNEKAALTLTTLRIPNRLKSRVIQGLLKTQKNTARVIQHGLIRLSKRQPANSARAWKKYQTTHSFSSSAASASRRKNNCRPGYGG